MTSVKERNCLWAARTIPMGVDGQTFFGVRSEAGWVVATGSIETHQEVVSADVRKLDGRFSLFPGAGPPTLPVALGVGELDEAHSVQRGGGNEVHTFDRPTGASPTVNLRYGFVVSVKQPGDLARRDVVIALPLAHQEDPNTLLGLPILNANSELVGVVYDTTRVDDGWCLRCAVPPGFS